MSRLGVSPGAPVVKAGMHRWWLGALVFTWAGVAHADVVPPGPPDCPDGHEATSDHGGPYCRPPLPTNCPPEHLPRVRRTAAYCEPPPEEPCPPGSAWTSDSATDLYCLGGYRCTTDADCVGEGACVEADLCITLIQQFRAGSYEVVHGLCSDGCDGDERTCVKAKRCEPKTKRVASSPDKAKPVARPEAESPDSTGSAPPADVGVEVPAAKPSGGCGSCVTGGGTGSAGWLAALAGVWLLRRRRDDP